MHQSSFINAGKGVGGGSFHPFFDKSFYFLLGRIYSRLRIHGNRGRAWRGEVFSAMGADLSPNFSTFKEPKCSLAGRYDNPTVFLLGSQSP